MTLPRTDAERDDRGPAIIVHGSVLGGFKFIGPFDTIYAALEWWRWSMFGVLKCPVTVALLEQPAGPTADDGTLADPDLRQPVQ